MRISHLLLCATGAAAATLQQVTENFGPNPRNVGFYIYVPDNLPANAPILVSPHWCSGSATAVYQGTQFATLASQHGFIVIYPDSPNSGKCWDVSSKQTLTHDGGGDSLGIVSMVRWTLAKYNSDPSRVFTTGISSGAMMTQVLVGAYPDVFAAGAAFAGVPFGCFAAPGDNSGVYGYWNDDCAKGRVVKTAQAWGDIVRAGFPGFPATGWRPKLQLFHGTNDEVLYYQNHLEAIKQWTNVLGLSATPVNTSNTPVSGWTKSSYGGGKFESFSAQGVSHNIQNQEGTVMTFFDLACKTGCFKHGGGGTTPPPVGTTTTTTQQPTPTGNCSAMWGQCGGNGWTGAKCCSQGSCKVVNEWYHQCL